MSELNFGASSRWVQAGDALPSDTIDTSDLVQPLESHEAIAEFKDSADGVDTANTYVFSIDEDINIPEPEVAINGSDDCISGGFNDSLLS